MRRLFAFLLTIVAIGAIAFLAEQWTFRAPGPAAQLGAATIVWIKPGEGSAAIAHTLQDARVIPNAMLFRLGARLSGKNANLRAGEYAVPSRASMADVMDLLISGKSIQHKITAAEGLTSQMIYDIVAKDPVLTGAAGVIPPEGSLLPETYLFTRGATRAEILARMMRAQRKLLAKLWPARAANLPFQTPQEAVTLASIVEKETAIPEERRHIAAVFVNRLRLGMKLQSDPTIIYGITKGYPLGRGIRESEITAATPYNTYAVTGLPPTPICNPGKDSVAAVLQPEPSNDLYFVANGTGGHVFTASEAQHLQNVARWRQIERSSTLYQPALSSSATTLTPLRGMTDSAALQAQTSAAPPPPSHARHRRRHWR